VTLRRCNGIGREGDPPRRVKRIGGARRCCENARERAVDARVAALHVIGITDLHCGKGDDRPARMRRITQLAALATVVLLAGQSVFAGAACIHWFHSGGDRSSACCAPAADCHGSIPMASLTTSCGGCGCAEAPNRASAPAVAQTESKAHRIAIAGVPVQLPAPVAVTLPFESFQSASSPGPVKHVLFHVFRI
jgi:hypothetical protein